MLQIEPTNHELMSKETEKSKRIPTIFYLAAAVVIMSAVMFASSIVTQLLMAIFITIISSKPVGFLQKKGVSSGLSVAIVLVFILVLSISLGGILGNSIANFTANLDTYNDKVSSSISTSFAFLATYGIDVSKDMVLNSVNPGTIMNFTAGLLNGLGGLMGNMAMILLIVAFMLAESSSYGIKLRAIMNQPESSLSHIHTAMDQINQYLGIKTITSLMTGAAVSILLWFIGVDFPFMWGLIAFLMNYIPNIGSIIAAIPAMFMALISVGLGGLVWTGIAYLAVNIIIGNIVEPRMMGKGLGISTLVVLLSLIFWGWILGTIGMFLSIPLTLAAKIVFESHDSTKWISVLLGTEEDAVDILDNK